MQKMSKMTIFIHCFAIFKVLELDYGNYRKIVKFSPDAHFLFHWDSPHVRLNSHCEPWSYEKKRHEEVKAYRKSV